VLEAYRQHVAERAALGVPPKPLDDVQTAALVELLKNPPAGEEAFLVDLLLSNTKYKNKASFESNGELAELAAEALKKTLLVFDAFHDVADKAKAGNANAQAVMQSCAEKFV
jgi:aconitate hydratase 2/2-methylisocitrate dehydratase